MKLLCVTSSYPRHAADVSGCFVREWLAAVQAHADEPIEARVVTWRAPHPEGVPRGLTSLVADEVPYAPPSFERLFHGAGAPEALAAEPWLAALVPGALVAMWRHLEEMIRSDRPDLLVGHWLVPSGALVRALGARHGIPVVIVTHSGGIAALSRLPWRVSCALARWCAGAEGMSFVSTHARERFERHAGRVPQGEILPMGFTPMRRFPDVAREDVVMLGRAVPIKGGQAAIRGFLASEICKQGKRLHVIGEGPELARWREVAREHGPEDVVVWHGQLTGAARDAVVARCRLSLFASRRLERGREEGVPVSFLECVEAGTWPLVAHVPGVSALLLEPERQRLPEEREARAWGRAIDVGYAASKDEARLEAQRERVRGLSWEVLGERWAKYLFEVARKESAG